MCNSLLNINNKKLVNIKTNKLLNLDRVKELQNNSILKVKPKLWEIWDFEKNDELGLDIWTMTKGSHKKSWWYCPICDNSYDQQVKNKINGYGCPYCVGQRVDIANCLATSHPELASQWHPKLNDKLTPYDVTYGSNKYAWWICDKGHFWKAQINSRRNINCGCPYCSGHKAWKGFNDIWTTNPELASKLLNPEDGYKHSQWSNKVVDWKCPNCKELIKNRKISTVNNNGLVCPNCSDKLSFPEKIMYNLLKYIEIEFEYDKTKQWSKGKRYDFYIPSLNTIIETHGEQHYKGGFKSKRKNLESEQENDKLKYEMALQNGITHYIVIDCRIRDFEYIMNSILNSKLIHVLDLKNVNWNKIMKDSQKSINIKMLELWNKGLNLSEISLEVCMHNDTISRILRNFAKLGLCEYDSYRARRKI